jgi:lipopolysaccharide/colanic/teichoic acid biosynthesis glycosyltransferase
MKNTEVRRYYDILEKKKLSLFVKRLFDIVTSAIFLILLSPVFLILSIIIRLDSKGSVLFKQTRVTQYGRHFTIFKFRTMVKNAEKIGSQVTRSDDVRITRIGRSLRKYRLDEIPQLLNIIKGDMSFVGTRPEVVKYVELYTDEMLATLLLPAGVTSNASIEYKDEESILKVADNLDGVYEVDDTGATGATGDATGDATGAAATATTTAAATATATAAADVDVVYMNLVLPDKMKFNLGDIERFSFMGNIKTMLRTVYALVKKDADADTDVVKTRSVSSEN